MSESGRDQTAGVWWTRALVDFAPRAKRYLRTRFPAIRHQHDDLVGETLVDLTESLQRRTGGLPGSWYVHDDPPQPDVDRFGKLAFTVLQRRVVDQFRSSANRFSEDIDTLSESQSPESPDTPIDRLVDLKRTASALFTTLETLPADDRALLQDVALGGSEMPMSDRDRQRLRRLRVELVDRLRSRLGPAALDCIRRF